MVPAEKQGDERLKRIYAELKQGGNIVSDDCPAFQKDGLILKSPHRP